MSSERRYVFDTNVIVSAVLFRNSVPGQAFDFARANGTILISTSLAEELRDVLSRAKFDRYITPEDRRQFLAAFVHDAHVVNIGQSVDACRDPRDNQILEPAVNGGAECIVTGDDDLLVLNPFQNIRIISPAEVLSVPQ